MKIYTELLKKRVLREMGEFDPSISPSFHQSMKKKFKKMKTMNLYIIIEREITQRGVNVYKDKEETPGEGMLRESEDV